MVKLENEVRDAIHGFIRFNSLEKELIDTKPFQRLRHISQLALTSFVYPGATHRRFEHCLGVMDLAGRVFDAVHRSALGDSDVCERLSSELRDEQVRSYWRQTLRIAALLHDIGHLPFSHAAEKELLPDGWNHERMTAEIIRKSEIAEKLEQHKPPIRPDDVVKLAWDRKKRPASEPKLSEWETILNEIICGDTFGVDRIDYLLRDSTHAGVSYGYFDPLRLIDNMTIVVDPASDACALAIEEGAMHGAEALLLARYFMYTQVYFHDVRRAYDKHLQQFLSKWLPNGQFSIEWQEFLKITDNEVWTGILDACNKELNCAHKEAERIIKRMHFRTVYIWNLAEESKQPDLWQRIVSQLLKTYDEQVLADRYVPKTDAASFPVRTENGSVENSLAISGVLEKLPPAAFGYIFADKPVFKDALRSVKEIRRAQ